MRTWPLHMITPSSSLGRRVAQTESSNDTNTPKADTSLFDTALGATLGAETPVGTKYDAASDQFTVYGNLSDEQQQSAIEMFVELKPFIFGNDEAPSLRFAPLSEGAADSAKIGELSSGQK